MSGRKRARSPLRIVDYDDEFDDDSYSNSSRNQQIPPIQRNAANARERARMRVLSSAFCRLKTKLPWVPPDTKLSKLDTLRLATHYIQQLRASLARDDESYQQTNSFEFQSSMNGNQQSLVWPFSFQHQSDAIAHRTTANINEWIARDQHNNVYDPPNTVSINTNISINQYNHKNVIRNGSNTCSLLNNSTAHG